MIQSPCKNCADRHTACHDTCKKYEAYKQELQKQKSSMKIYARLKKR